MDKKKILIFSSYGGGGHISAANALIAYLKNEYIVETIYVFDEVLGILDPIKLFSLKHYTGEAFYNYCLRKKWTGLINFLYRCATYGLRLERPLIRSILEEYLHHKKPDVLISVVPLINGTLEYTCQKLKIPFLLIPTDLDVTTFIQTMQSTNNATIKIALTFNDSSVLAAFHHAHIPASMITLTGFPLKPTFSEQKNVTQIKHDFHVPEHKPVILLLMGAAGSKATYTYVKQLIRSSLSFHILICLGKNEKMRNNLEKLKLPSHISTTIISQTDRIADLMSISTLCITKSGTVSVCETIYKELPVILDATTTPLIWEKFNLSFIQHHGFGKVVKNYEELNPIVEQFLSQPAYIEQIKKNLAKFEKINFGEHIKNLVEILLKKQ